jgi:hypothetical protein
MCALQGMSSPRTPHGEHAMTKDGRWKVSFDIAAPFYRVRSGKSQRLRCAALNGTSSSARSRQPPEPESSIRVPGHVPVTRIHRDSSRCVARALAPPVCDTPLTGFQVHGCCAARRSPLRGKASTGLDRTAALIRYAIGASAPALRVAPHPTRARRWFPCENDKQPSFQG